MNEATLKPEKITKPIQLLGAWLAGLLSIDACFLFAASRMPAGSWEADALIVAAIINVPLFLIAVFLLQTRFRPELQEDAYYSTYLSRKTNEPISVSKEDSLFASFRQRLAEIENRLAAPASVGGEAFAPPLFYELHVGVNKHLADRQRIGEKLSQCGVPGFSVFGAAKAPGHRIVAISEVLAQNRIDGIVAVAKDLDFTGYTFFDKEAEDIEEDVLFGAYGSADYAIAGSAAGV